VRSTITSPLVAPVVAAYQSGSHLDPQPVA
jgi:hypothetical protein